MKKGRTDPRMNSKKVIKPTELKKIRLKLKTQCYNKLANKHNTTQISYNNKVVDSLIFNKNTHMSIVFKESMILDFGDEFLKRFYKSNESKERIPKIANYYKNYLTFFCNPIFRDFRVNSIIQLYSDNKAELYYNKTYSNKPKKDKKASSFLFNTLIRDDIDHHVLTAVTEVDVNNNDTSIFNDEFFIYRPEKKRLFDNDEKYSSNLILDYSRNNSHIKSGLLTMHSREEEILNIVSNLNKPLNERIIDKIQKGTKKGVTSTYNFSTTDKSKGEEAQGLNIFNKKGSEVNNNKNEIYRINQLLKQDNDNESKIKKIENFHMINSPLTPTDHEKQPIIFNPRKSLEMIQVTQVPNSSKNKNLFNNQIIDNSDKSPLSSTVKNKLTMGQTTTNNKKPVNKIIEYKHIKMTKPSSSTKFANLLYSSEANYKNLSSNNRTNSNPHSSKNNVKSIKNLDVNKYHVEMNTPNTYQNNNNDNKFFELSTKHINEDKQLTIHLDKIFRSRHLSTHNANYENLIVNCLKNERANSKNTDKLTKESEIGSIEANKMKKLRSDQNFLASNNSKLNNYLNNSKKITSATGFSEDSHQVVSSFTNIKTSTNNNNMKIKFNLNDRQSSNHRSSNMLDTKGKAYNYYQPEQQTSKNVISSSRGFSKTKELTHAISENKLLKKSPINRRMKSGEFFSNNYLTTNNSNNVNALLHKINSTRNVNYATEKSRKNQFSPSSLIKKL